MWPFKKTAVVPEPEQQHDEVDEQIARLLDTTATLVEDLQQTAARTMVVVGRTREIHKQYAEQKASAPRHE